MNKLFRLGRYAAMGAIVLGLGATRVLATSPFPSLAAAGLPSVDYASVAWGDYDNDGHRGLDQRSRPGSANGYGWGRLDARHKLGF